MVFGKGAVRKGAVMTYKQRMSALEQIDTAKRVMRVVFTAICGGLLLIGLFGLVAILDSLFNGTM